MINLVGKRLEESSRDPECIARRRADPLAYKNVNFGYLLDMQRSSSAGGGKSPLACMLPPC